MDKCKFKSMDLSVLYIMVFFTLIHSCNASKQVDDVVEVTSRIEAKVDSMVCK